jgi:hypothetical protein
MQTATSATSAGRWAAQLPFRLRDMSTLTERIELALPLLSPQFRAIGQYCLENAAGLHRMRIEDVSLNCGARPSTIVRFAKRFGLNGFKELKFAFLGVASATEEDAPLPAEEGDVENDALKLLRAGSVLLVDGAEISPITAYLACALRCMGREVSVMATGPEGDGWRWVATSYDVLILVGPAAVTVLQDGDLSWAREHGVSLVRVGDDGGKPHSGQGVEALRHLNRSVASAHALIQAMERRCF